MKFKLFQKQCRWIPLLGVIFICIFSYTWLQDSIPDKIRIVVDREENFEFRVPVTGVVDGLTGLSEEQVNIDMNEEFTLKSSDKGEFSIICKLFGVFSLKEVTVEVIDKEMVVPCGIPIGIYVQTQGILAIGTGEVITLDGTKAEPAHGLVKSGDYIEQVNGENIATKEDLMDKIEHCDGVDIILGIRRNNEQIEIKVTPVKTAEATYKIGVWIRDDMAGVGTMTCYTTEKHYVALGHPISDIDIGTPLEIQEGKLYKTNIIGITKGEKGKPGEMAGVINYNDAYCIGTVDGNSETGISGELTMIPEDIQGEEYIEVGLKQEMQVGPATIVSYISGERKEYVIEITNLNYNSASVNKGIQFQVVDEELLNLTGGIVQGMSGSPIIQDGKLVGAVTHVLVNDPTRGYGIFIENMLEAAG